MIPLFETADGSGRLRATWVRWLRTDLHDHSPGARRRILAFAFAVSSAALAL